MIGAVLSVTVTGNEPEARLPAASVALHCTVVVPNANVEPDAGVHVTTGEAGLASVALAAHVATAPLGPVASTETAAGRLNVGGVESQPTTVPDTGTVPVSLYALPAIAVPAA